MKKILFLIFVFIFANAAKLDFNAVSKVDSNASADWDNNLTTKIVNNKFPIYILSKKDSDNKPISANITKVIFYYYSDGNNTDCNGTKSKDNTICDDSDSSNKCPDTNSSGEVEMNVTIDSAVKCIQVHIEGKNK